MSMFTSAVPEVSIFEWTSAFSDDRRKGMYVESETV